MKKVLLLFSLILLFNCGNSTPDESDVKDVARIVILQKLKNPIDVKFHHNETIMDLGYNTYEYKETINATNSFGGSIKQTALVKIKWLKNDPSDETNWTLINIRFY